MLCAPTGPSSATPLGAVEKATSVPTGASSGASPVGVAIALDRQEKGAEGGVDQSTSAVQYITSVLGLEVCAIATLVDLLHYLSVSGNGSLAPYRQAVAAYRDRYGV